MCPLVVAEAELPLPWKWDGKPLLRRFLIYVLLPAVVTSVLFVSMFMLLAISDYPVPDENGMVRNYPQWP